METGGFPTISFNVSFGDPKKNVFLLVYCYYSLGVGGGESGDP